MMHSKTNEGGAAARVIRIAPSRGFGTLGLQEVWEYRDLLWMHVIREVKGKYRQMALGPIWIVLQPLVYMVVLSFVFGTVAKLDTDGVPYPIFTFTALIPWTFFANACQLSVVSLVADMHVISKVYFPRLILPVATVLARLVDFAVCCVILFGMMLWYGEIPGIRVLALPLYLLFAVLTVLAIGTWTASLAVRFRDLKFVVQYGVQVAMYLTPVGYAAKNLPQEWMWLFQLNPMFWVIEGFRWSLLGSGYGPQRYMAIPVGIVLVMLVSGAFVFRRTERTIVDLL